MVDKIIIDSIMEHEMARNKYYLVIFILYRSPTVLYLDYMFSVETVVESI